MKEVKIPGSKYNLCLENDNNQWFLRLRIDGKIETESPVTHMHKKAIKSNIQELLKSVHHDINNVQLDIIHKEISQSVSQILGETDDDLSTQKEFGVIQDPRVPELENRIDQLNDEIKKLEQLVSEKESELNF